MKPIFKKKEEKIVENKKEMEVTLLYIDIEQFEKEIYEAIAGKERIKKNCKFIRRKEILK